VLENGETQMNVLAPYRIALFLPSIRDAISAKKVVAPFPQVGTSRYPWRFQCSSLIAQFESPSE